MTKYGKIIAKYRKLNGLTQSQLAEQLFISPQAVSKWENDQSVPDLPTIKKLTKIFGITLDEFDSEGNDLVSELNEEKSLDESCIVCQNNFDEQQLTNYNNHLVCKDCIKELKEEDMMMKSFTNETPKQIKRKIYSPKTAFLIGAIITAIIFIILIVIYFIGNNNAEDSLTFGQYLIVTVLLTISLGTLVTQMLYESWLKYFLFGFLGKSVGMPGVIFELSIDGLIMLIIVKVVLGLIVLIIGLLIALLGLVISMLIAPITYIIELIVKIRKGFDYELV